MFIVLTKEHACINTEKRFLGKWCIDYSQLLTEIERHEHITLPYPFDQKDSPEKAYRYLQAVDKRLFPMVCKAINRLHNVNYSDRYWRIVIGYWWQEFISGLYEKYICLKEASLRWPDAKVKTLPDEYWFTPYDSWDVLQLTKQDAYNHQLFSQIIQSLNLFHTIPFTSAELKQLSFGTGYLPPLRTDWRNWIKKAFCLCSRWNQYYMAASYMPKRQMCLTALKLKTFPTLVDTPRFFISTHREIDKSFRDKLDGFLSAQDEFEKLIISTWIQNLPKIYCEDFHGLAHRVKKYFPKTPLRSIFTAAAFSHNDGFKLFTAEQTEQHATPYLIAQHGANYGVSAWNPSEDYEKDVADYFLTYGWGDEKEKKVIPFIINLLSKQHDKVTGKPDGNIILVLTSQMKYSYMYYAIPRGPQIVNYFKEQAKFLRALSPAALQKIRIRPYMNSSGWHDLDYLAKQTKCSIPLSNQKVLLREEAKHASLVISTYDSTSILEMFSINVPTLLYWNPNYTPRRAMAVPIYRKLNECGILYHDPIKAAQHLSAIHQHAAEWWQQAEIQQVRKEFCDLFAATSANYSNAWQQMIKQLSVQR